MDVGVNLPTVKLPGGLLIMPAALTAVDYEDPNAVVLHFIGGSSRTLDEAQSAKLIETFKLDASQVIKPKGLIVPR